MPATAHPRPSPLLSHTLNSAPSQLSFLRFSALPPASILPTLDVPVTTPAPPYRWSHVRRLSLLYPRISLPYRRRALSVRDDCVPRPDPSPPAPTSPPASNLRLKPSPATPSIPCSLSQDRTVLLLLLITTSLSRLSTFSL
ncbi:hypothetical protein CesoFtcFv8_013418 [Champsocephalus esox]|uniref:Uncharacterized protein n=1 Tax=Champsocephalus esox TaxID=159716 RepID=A0AAN8GT86_9TELE|nr:hypothetical protein CesoFtcFv8_013418 [Champsocephalus esox]